MSPILPRSFYARATVDVARELLGQILVHGPPESHTAGVIVETEAYLGAEDLAAHSSRGITPRTQVIFGEAGHAYVYFVYGMYWCLNVVTESPGTAGCVLIRAVRPVRGIELMRQRRGGKKDVGLTSGPGKLAMAMGITGQLNGCDLTCGDLRIERGEGAPCQVAVTPRIGISKCVDWPLRFTCDPRLS